MSKCPSCDRELAQLAPDDERRKLLPFCSERCKLIDLGAWITERYRVPGEHALDVGLNRDEDEE